LYRLGSDADLLSVAEVVKTTAFPITPMDELVGIMPHALQGAACGRRSSRGLA
jgi:uncharacterized protein (UPF0210 family)